VVDRRKPLGPDTVQFLAGQVVVQRRDRFMRRDGIQQYLAKKRAGLNGTVELPLARELR
jgi:hypothetical protein